MTCGSRFSLDSCKPIISDVPVESHNPINTNIMGVMKRAYKVNGQSGKSLPPKQNNFQVLSDGLRSAVIMNSQSKLCYIIHLGQLSNLIGPFVPRDHPEKNDIGRL